VTPVCVTTVGAQTNDDDDNGDNDTSRFFCYIKTFRCYILPPWDTSDTPFSHREGTNGAELVPETA